MDLQIMKNYFEQNDLVCDYQAVVKTTAVGHISSVLS